jgi:DNA polymerase V
MSHGGKRPGAGRPKGSVKEQTRPVRIPVSRIKAVKQLISGELNLKLPLYLSRVRAGFPSPADDFIEDRLDLNDYLIKHPSATFLVRAEGDSMLNAGIHDGDVLIVDKSLEPAHGKIVIAAIDGELTVKRLYRKEGVVKLQAENPSYPDIDITEAQETVIWGIVTNVIHGV